jgi:hypothetical protein
MAGAIPITETALLLCDLQNDFIHPKGAYARGGQSDATIAALPRIELRSRDGQAMTVQPARFHLSAVLPPVLDDRRPRPAPPPPATGVYCCCC